LKKNGIELWLRPTATPRPQTQNEVTQDACATR
jgi:hypothetical protein